MKICKICKLNETKTKFYNRKRKFYHEHCKDCIIKKVIPPKRICKNYDCQNLSDNVEFPIQIGKSGKRYAPRCMPCLNSGNLPEKKCIQCGDSSNDAKFGIKYADGIYASKCNSCIAKERRNAPKKEKEHRRITQNKWRTKNKEKVNQQKQDIYNKDVELFRKKQREIRAKNPEKYRKMANKYHEKNKDKINAGRRSQRRENPEKYRGKAKIYRAKNKDHLNFMVRQYRGKNKDKINARIRQKRKENPEPFRAIDRKRYRKNPAKHRKKTEDWFATEKGYVWYLVNNARYADNKRRLDLENLITIEEVNLLKTKQNNQCVYLGIEMLWGKHNSDSMYRASIDRINPNLGHTFENCQLVVECVNYFRLDLTHFETIDLFHGISTSNIECEHDQNEKMVIYKKKDMIKAMRFQTNDHMTMEQMNSMIVDQNNQCTLTGIELCWHPNCIKVVSKDRINPNDKSYAKENVQLIMWPINRLKHTWSNEQTKEVIKIIKEKYSY